MALIAVLWVTSLLAVIAFSLSATDRTASKLAFNAVEKTKARHLANAGIQHAVFTLMTEPKFSFEVPRSYLLGRYDDCMHITIDDEGAKIDLNKAPQEMIESLVVIVGAGAKEAAGLSGQITGSRPFLRIEQLFHMPGMNDALYRKLTPHVTVYGEGQGIDPLRASDTVLRSLPGMSDDQVETLRDGIRNNEPLEDLILPIIDYIALSKHQTFTIRVRGETANGGHTVREAVVSADKEQASAGSGEDAPFKILAWRYGEAMQSQLHGKSQDHSGIHATAAGCDSLS